MTIKKRLVGLAVAASLALSGAVTLGVETASAASPALSSSHVPWIFGTATPRVNGLRLRTGPSTHYRTRGLLYRGDRMRVLEEAWGTPAGSWFRVKLTRRSASGLRSGTTGWVYAPYLRKA